VSGTRVKEGGGVELFSTVEVQVANVVGKRVPMATVRTVTVPTLSDMSCSEADTVASNAGLKPVVCRVQSPLPIVLGAPTVFHQSVPAGQEVDEGNRRPRQRRRLWQLPHLF